MPSASPRSSVRRLRGGLLATALAATVLVVPVGLADTASAQPCPPILPCIVPPAATTAPKIPATARIGDTLTVTPPVWDQDGVTTTYQWMRDGDAITGATKATYELVGDDFETEISVHATGTNALGVPGTSDSGIVEPAKGPAITATTPPVVTGSGTVGDALTTTDGSWGTPEPSFTYQWYRSRPSGTGSQLIAGATTTTYTPVAGDAGRTIVAVVIAERIGYEKGAAASNVKTVPKARSSATLSLPQRTVRTSQNASVRVVLGSSAGIVPTGRITIYDGARAIRTVGIAAQAGGAKTFALPRLKAGQHRLTARYAGDGAHLASTSGVQVLTVTR